MSRFVMLVAFLMLGCAQRGEEAALPNVVLVQTQEEPGFDPSSAANLATSAEALDPPELVWDEELIPLHEGLSDPPSFERIDWRLIEAAVTTDNLGEPEQFSPDGSLGPRLTPMPRVTPLFHARTGAAKAAALPSWGREESERAVAMGLAWLAKQQKEDGGWEFDVGEKSERVAATGLALLAFLGAGETHDWSAIFSPSPPGAQPESLFPGRGEKDRLFSPSKTGTTVYRKDGKYRATVKRGLDFLLKHCPLSGVNAGRMSANAYSHAIGTLALCEAYAMTRDKPLLLAPAQAAINHSIKSQAANGSWGYTPGSPGDISIVGWQVQAFHAARLGKDIVIPEQTLTKTVDFLNFASAGSRKAMYGYNDSAGAAPKTNLTAVGLLCRYYIDGWNEEHAGFTDGVTGLMKRAPRKSPQTPPMYFYYHASQVLRFYGGEEWAIWHAGPKDPATGLRQGGMRDWLVSIQIKKDGANQGSFDPDADWIGRNCGRLGTTAMCILTLETYYRYPLLPVAPPK